MARDRGRRDRAPDGWDDEPSPIDQLERWRSRRHDTIELPPVPADDPRPPRERRWRPGPGLLAGAALLVVALALSGLAALGVGPVAHLLGSADAPTGPAPAPSAPLSSAPSTSAPSTSAPASSAPTSPAPASSAPASAVPESSAPSSADPAPEPPTGGVADPPAGPGAAGPGGGAKGPHSPAPVGPQGPAARPAPAAPPAPPAV